MADEDSQRGLTSSNTPQLLEIELSDLPRSLSTSLFNGVGREAQASKHSPVETETVSLTSEAVSESRTLVYKTSAADGLPLLSADKDADVEEGDQGQDGSHSGFSGASLSGAVLNLSTTVVGAGIMALPATMKVLGLPLGITMIALMGWLSEASVKILIKFSLPIKARSYLELVDDNCGRIGRWVVQICIIFGNSGVLIVYVIIIGDVLCGSSGGAGEHHTGVLEEWSGGSSVWTSRPLILLLSSALVLGPLSSFSRLDSLRFTSGLSIALAVLFVVIAVSVFLVKLAWGKIHAPRLLPDLTSATAVLRIIAVMPIMSLAYVCHFNLHPIWLELERPDEATISRVVRITFILCTVVYIAIATAGYLLFGDSTADDVLANFDTNLGVPFSWVLDMTVRLGYALHVMLVFPLVHHSLRNSVDASLFPNARPLVSDTRRLLLLTAVLVGVIYVGATLIPSIWVAFQLTGATTSVTLAFILPALIALRSTSGIANKSDKRMAWSLLALGVVIGVVGSLSNISDLFSSFLHQSNESGLAHANPRT